MNRSHAQPEEGTMLYRYCIVELLKLRRSLVLLLCVAAPSLVALLTLLVNLRQNRAPNLVQLGTSSAGFWAIAMLPLAVTALSVLLAQMEHGPRSWNHLLTLPSARPHVYLAKALIMFGLVLAMSTLLWLETVANAWLIATVRPDAIESLNPYRFAELLGRMTAATILICILQLWAALRFRSLVPPLILGIGGTFCGLAASSSPEGHYFPWLMASRMLAPPDIQNIALALGSVGGIVLLFIMLFDMGRREI